MPVNKANEFTLAMLLSNSHTVPECGCWLWAAHIGVQGYGRVSFQGKDVTAHRASWQIHFGAIPDGMMVLHRCDTPSCINPDHLFLGTHRENMADMKNKRRQSRTKLTSRQALSIRADDRPIGIIAAFYKVNPSTIRNIKTNRAWKQAELYRSQTP